MAKLSDHCQGTQLSDVSQQGEKDLGQRAAPFHQQELLWEMQQRQECEELRVVGERTGTLEDQIRGEREGSKSEVTSTSSRMTVLTTLQL